MRLDPSKESTFKHSPLWQNSDLKINVVLARDEKNPGKGLMVRSFSGNERNRTFLQTDDNFDDVSLLSGADFREDGRGFVFLDYDQDGWLDLGVISPHEPRFRLLRNRMQDHITEVRNSAFINLVGGHQGTESQTQWSSRDAIGATLLVTIGDRKQAYQTACGEGLASQNSKWLHIGMGTAEKIDRVEIVWPSGKKTVRENILAGQRVTVLEKE